MEAFLFLLIFGGIAFGVGALLNAIGAGPASGATRSRAWD